MPRYDCRVTYVLVQTNKHVVCISSGCSQTRHVVRYMESKDVKLTCLCFIVGEVNDEIPRIRPLPSCKIYHDFDCNGTYFLDTDEAGRGSRG